MNFYDTSPLSGQISTLQNVDVSSAVMPEAKGMRALAAFAIDDEVRKRA